MAGEATREVTRNDIRYNRVKNELNRVKDELEPTTKNNLRVDAISRQAVDRLVWEYLRKPTDENIAFYEHFLELPPVTPQEPRKLEQEHDKPMVEIDLYSVIKQKYIEREVLDKIRAEIMQLDYDIEFIDYDYNDMAQTEEVHTIYREEVLQIIDKYKSESEGK